ncbi:MAG: class I SAM-dependent methyltransferase [Scrofimicrobium sp.]
MDSVRHLLADEGQLVDTLPDYDARTANALSRELRERGYAPDLVSAALTQQKLRARARAKFGDDAAWMIFTDAGYQQATRRVVADLHAQRYRRAGCRNVLDMTSGIGADSMAFARAGLEVTAVDIDEVTSACAKHNLAGFPSARTLCGDVLDLDLGEYDGAFADPGRRSARGRTFDPRDYTPPLDRILEIRRIVPALGVKVAPGIAYEELPEDAHAQWVSVDGSVVEAGLWFGPLADHPGRSALVITGEGMTEVSASDDPRAPAKHVPAEELGQYLYEPDGAVIRSGAVAEVSRRLNAPPVSEGIAYLSGDTLVQTSLATAFRVLDVVPIKRVREYLRARQVGSVEILKRGTDIVPDQFRKSLRLKGQNFATIILTRLKGKHSCLVVERVGW